jgi:hypothetical protein
MAKPRILNHYLPDADRRLARVRRVAWFLDQSIDVGGGRKIGVGPLLGLVPGIGDAMGGLIGLYIVFEGARMGLPLWVVSRMAFNLIVETAVGTVPIAGDLFDFVWKASSRNAAMVERHYRPGMRPRPVKRIVGLALAAGLGIIVSAAAVLAAIILLTIRFIVQAIG